MNLFGKTIHPRAAFREASRRFFKAVCLPADVLFCAWSRFPYRFDTRLLGYPCVRNRGTIRIGKGVVLCSRQGGNTIGVPQAVRLTVARGGRLSIGAGAGISGSSIYATREISIGARVRIGSGCLVMDNDAHPLDPVDRAAGHSPVSAPVRIADDAFIGARSIILKGVSIGEAAVVGAGSVVTKDVPPRAIVAGNPARAVGTVPA